MNYCDSICNKRVETFVFVLYVVYHTSAVRPEHGVLQWEVDFSSNHLVQPGCYNSSG